jgi:hypothetical protein
MIVRMAALLALGVAGTAIAAAATQARDAAPDPAQAKIEAAAQAASNGRADEADRLMVEACADLDARLGAQHPDTLECERSRVFLWNVTGQYPRAFDAAKAMLDARRAALGDDHPQTLRIASDFGLLQMNTGDVQGAIATHRWALAGRTRVLGPRHPHTLDSLANLAQALDEAGFHAEALPLNREAFEASREVLGPRDRDTLISGLNLAINLAQLGRTDEALELHEAVYADAKREFGDDDMVTIAVQQALSVGLDDVGRQEDALALKEAIVERLRRVHGPANPRTIRNLSNLAFSYAVAGQAARALETSGEALDAGRALFGPTNTETMYLVDRRAQALIAAGRRAEAIALLDDALAASAAVLAPGHRVRILMTMRRWEAAYADTRGREAVDALRPTLDLARSALGPSHPDTLVAMERLAGAAERAGDEALAIDQRRQLRDAVEALRASSRLPRELRQSALARAAGGYKTLARLELRRGEVAASFASGEMAKGRTLVDSLAQRRADRVGVIPAADADRIAEYEARIARLDADVAQAADAEARLQVLARRNALAREAADFRAELRRRYPRYAHLTDVPPADLAAREALPADAAYVGYLVADGRVLGWALGRRGPIVGRDLGDAATLVSAIDAWRAQVAQPGAALAWRLPDGRFATGIAAPAPAAVRVDERALGTWIADRLVTPFAATLAAKARWIVSPDDLVAALPLEALPWRGARIVERRHVSYVPSLAVHRLLVDRHREYRAVPSRGPLLAVGAPRYARRAANVAGPTGVAAGDVLRRAGGDVTRALGRLALEWTDLPGSAREVDAVAAQFPGALVWKGAQASEAALVAHHGAGRLATHRYLLFATHGFLAPDAPLLSSIVLDQHDLAPGTDGYVTAAEWTGLGLRSDLVMLSACETGLGKLVPGEGIVGLPYALFVAGNADALVSLWPVLDGSTADFSREVFARIARGERHGTALTAVKRAFLRDPRRASPRHWAGFVLYGAR